MQVAVQSMIDAADGEILDKQLKVARSATRVEGQTNKLAEQRRSDILRSYDAENRREPLGKVRAQSMVAEHLGQSCGLCPDAFASLDWRCPATALATRMLSAVRPHTAAGTQFLTDLGKEWDAMHGTIMHDHCPPVPAAPAMSACLLAERCLCSGEGKQLFALRNAWYLRCFMVAFPRDGPDRALALEGLVVAKVQGWPRDADIVQQASAETFWWHLGMHCRTPPKEHVFGVALQRACR